MDKLYEIIKIFIEKHLIHTITTFVLTICTHLFLSNDNFFIIRLGNIAYYIFLFCCWFLVIQFFGFIYKMIESSLNNKRVNTKKQQECIKKVNKYFDSLSEKNKNIILTFLKNGNKPMIDYGRGYNSDITNLLNNSNLFNSTNYAGNSTSINKEYYWISPDLERSINSGTILHCGLVQYKIKDDNFRFLLYIYKKYHKLGNF